ncbi:MAG: hypothetical protein ABIL09_21580, partial [Gemmatimonadota bacterium]
MRYHRFSQARQSPALDAHRETRGRARTVATLALVIAVSMALPGGAQQAPPGRDVAPGQQSRRPWIPAADQHPGHSRVAMVRSDYKGLAEPIAPDQDLTRLQIEAVVRAALAELGGMQAFVGPDDDWVMIKPNIVRASARGRGDITDAYVVWALAKM